MSCAPQALTQVVRIRVLRGPNALGGAAPAVVRSRVVGAARGPLPFLIGGEALAAGAAGWLRLQPGEARAREHAHLAHRLATRGEGFAGKTVVVSGAGNVALHTVEKVNELGGKVVAICDYDGAVHDPAGIDAEKLAYTKDLVFNRRGSLKQYAEKYRVGFIERAQPWSIPCDVAFPCAAENTLDGDQARTLIKNGCFCVVEGANMPTTPEGVTAFLDAKILFAPGKAANAGGVATSGLEMAQNAMHLSWTRDEVDQRLHQIMRNIHRTCVEYGRDGDFINYVDGANRAGFIKVANAMIAQGIV